MEGAERPRRGGDDVIGTLACMGTQQGFVTVISSGDKDLSQLVNEHVTVIDTMNDRKRDMAGVEVEFGVPPRLMIDYQTLVGDSVDNVPGVDKVGPKTAVKLLKNSARSTRWWSARTRSRGPVGENLRKALEWLPKGRALLTIRTDCDLKDHIPGFPELEDIVIGGQDVEKLKVFYDRYGFKGLVKQLESHDVPPELMEENQKRQRGVRAAGRTGGLFEEPDLSGLSQATTLHYETIFTWDQFETWMQRIEERRWWRWTPRPTRSTRCSPTSSACPSAPTGAGLLHPARAQLPGRARPAAARRGAAAACKPWLEDPEKKKLGQHVKYDRHVFANHGIEVRGYAHDTMLQSYVLEVHKPHGLASLAERHLGRTGIDYETVAGKGVHQITFNQVPVDKAAEYSCEDSDQTLDVHLALYPKLERIRSCASSTTWRSSAARCCTASSATAC
jgi:DNA polymerase-1